MSQRKTKQTTKAKIDRMVADGAKNYPAYLKLIYTGDSELSSEDEFSSHVKVPAQNNCCYYTTPANRQLSKATVAKNFNDVSSPGQESAKLKDEGREKSFTPLDENKAGQCMELAEASLPIQDDDINVQSSWYCQEEEDNKFEMEKELFQIQEEITTLKSLLETKVALANQLKRKLGLTPMSELRSSFKSIKHSETFLKTNAALRSLGNLATRTIGSLKFSSPFSKHPQECLVNPIKQSQSLGNMHGEINTKVCRSEADIMTASMR